LFGGKTKTPAEMMREYKRNVDRSVREIEREKTKLQQQEKKVIADIKKAAKDGQMGPVKIMAKDLVRTRNQITKFYQMKCQMQAVGLRLQTIKSTQAMTEAMKGAAKAMRAMNAAVKPIAMQKILMEFEKQNQLMEDKQEMMDDAMDDAMEAEDEEGQVEEVVGQVHLPASRFTAGWFLSDRKVLSDFCIRWVAGAGRDWHRLHGGHGGRTRREPAP